MTKEQFKKRWESDEDGGGITFDDVAECAKKWGLFSSPKTHDINDVLKAVLKAANVEDQTETRKENKKKMGQLVYILGRSGTGKSYSMRNFPKDKLAVINVQGKILPFKGSAAVEQTSTDNSTDILKALEIYAHDYKSIVIDDYQYVMSNEFMRRSAEKGYDKFTEIARHAWDIANKVRSLPDDVIVYIMCHTDRDDEGNEKIKTIGKLLDEKICLEGLSTIVLKTNVSDGQYTFLTQNNGKDTVKSPFGMFPTYAIDKDLWYVDQKIRNYYEMEGHASDEEMQKMDDEAEKPEVQKPEATEGRRRRNRQSAVKESDGSGNDSASAADTRSTEVAEGNAEPVKRERKQRTPAPEATESASVEEGKELPTEGRKRRRKAKNEASGSMPEDWMNIPENVSDEEVPFKF